MGAFFSKLCLGVFLVISVFVGWVWFLEHFAGAALSGPGGWDAPGLGTTLALAIEAGLLGFGVGLVVTLALWATVMAAGWLAK